MDVLYTGRPSIEDLLTVFLVFLLIQHVTTLKQLENNVGAFSVSLISPPLAHSVVSCII